MNKRNAAELMTLYDLSKKDLTQISSFKPVIEKNIEALIDSFYDWLEKTPEHEEFFHEKEILEHAKAQQIKYWLSFFNGDLDDEYLA